MLILFAGWECVNNATAARACQRAASLKRRTLFQLSMGGIFINFILASQSPRRLALLKQARIKCEAISSGADERISDDLPPEEIVRLLAGRKADAALALREWPEPFVIIAADTVVCLNGRVMGKPRGREDACAMLNALQGCTHKVYTGVALRYESKIILFTETALVTMRSMSQEDIRRYIMTGEPDDKAGAYGAQGLGAAFIERVEGDFHTVVGLPLARLCKELRALGIDYMESWTEV